MVDARAAIAHLQFAIVCALSPALAAQLVRVAFGTKSSAAVPIVPVCANVAAENAVSVGYPIALPFLSNFSQSSILSLPQDTKMQNRTTSCKEPTRRAEGEQTVRAVRWNA